MKRLILFCGLMLVACQPAPTSPTYEAPRFTHLPTIAVNVDHIAINNRYQMPLVRPYIEHLFPVSLEEGVTQWKSDRLRAIGHLGEMELVIIEASVVETELPTKKGLKGAFINELAERYDATLIVEARLYDGEQAMSAANARVEVRQSRSIAENASIEEREKLFYHMARGMMQLFDAEMERQLQQNFAAHITMQR